MAVNIGSTVSMLATPWIKDHWGWHAAFAVCCGGMLLAILNFMLMHRTLAHVGSLPDDQPIRWKRLGAVALGGVGRADHAVRAAAQAARRRQRVDGRVRDPRDLRVHDRESERSERAA